MPVSFTSKRRRSSPSARPSHCTLMSIQPSEVNLIALLTKLLRIWRSRSGSTRSAGLMRGSTIRRTIRHLLLALPR